MYFSFNFIILIIVFVSFTIGLNLGLHGMIAFPQPFPAPTTGNGVQLDHGSGGHNKVNVQDRTRAPDKYSPQSQFDSHSKTFRDTGNQHPQSEGDVQGKPTAQHELNAQQPDLMERERAGMSGGVEDSNAFSMQSSESLSSIDNKLKSVQSRVLQYLQNHIDASPTTAPSRSDSAVLVGGVIPILLLTANRPQLLKETLKSLLAVRGVSKSNIIVSQDGAMKEVSEIILANSLTLVQNTKGLRLRGGAGSDGAARIAQHYKFSLSTAFDTFPDADAVIVVEDDLLFSPDMYEYLTYAGLVLAKDPTTFVVSAWSDDGFKGKVKDAHALRRTDYFPGLGWLLTRQLYKMELEPKWPNTHWDHWLRSAEISKHRDIVFPQVPRTYHNGIKGTFMNLETHNKYFRDIDYNTDPAVSWSPASLQPLEVPAPSGGALPADAYYLQARKDVYDHRIEQLIKQCNHVSSVAEILEHHDEIICVWIEVSTDCEHGDVPFAPIASFFGLWHEHRRGNYRGLHEFYWENNNYLLLLNTFDPANLRHSLRDRGHRPPKTFTGLDTPIGGAAGAEQATFKYLMPSTARPIPPNQFNKGVLMNARRRRDGIRSYKASSPGLSCDQVCAAESQHCEASKLPLVNSCEALQEQFTCMRCETSVGLEQPAYVRPDASAQFMPGACLVTSQPELTSCSASHPATYRLCTCA